MSTHSKPRRWTLTWGGSWVAMAYNTPEIRDGQVRVREDCITEADVEALAKLLDPLLLMPRSASTREPRLAECQRYARTLLAHIFEGGEQS